MTNRATKLLTSAAKKRARERLQSRDRSPLLATIAASHLPSALVRHAAVLLTTLGSILGVDPALLRASDIVGALFRVQRHELNSIDDVTWHKLGFQSYIEPFSYELMFALERLSDRSKWEALWHSLEHPPKSEEEWIDHILAMSVREFLQFFAPVVADHSAGAIALE